MRKLDFGESTSPLKNDLGTRFRPESVKKHADSGTLWTRFSVTTASVPIFSTQRFVDPPGTPGGRSARCGGSLAALACVTVYVACFAFSLGPIVWLMMSEIFPLQVRGSAMSVATIALWVSNIVVALTFLSMIERFGNTATFWLYGLICAAAWVFVYLLVPETKERSLEEIEADLRERSAV
jgi:MFS family permease